MKSSNNIGYISSDKPLIITSNIICSRIPEETH